MEEVFEDESLKLPISIVYTVGCKNSLEVVNFCRENNIAHELLEFNQDPKAKSLKKETPFNSTPMIFDADGWLIGNYNTYEKVLGEII